MTYWATLWYAGTVVLTMGSEGQSLNDCELIGRAMMQDITASYANPKKQQELQYSVFPENQFTVTCETERLPIDKRYME